jgi:hypothetical protein
MANLLALKLRFLFLHVHVQITIVEESAMLFEPTLGIFRRNSGLH